jgi:hypothetical protein
MIAVSEVDILCRIIDPEKPAFPIPFAKQILRWSFSKADIRRMEHLSEKAQIGNLTRPERVEAESYERVGHFLSILKSKARNSLKTAVE